MMQYPHTIPPYDHQIEALNDHWGDEWFAVFWEQGCGKMKHGYDVAMTQWQAGQIDAMVVISPKGVHRDWIEEAFKEPNPNSIYDQPLIPPMWHNQIEADYYDTPKAKTKQHQQRMKELLETSKFSILSMAYSAARTKPNKKWMGGKLFLKEFLTRRKAILILDESSFIQTPSSDTTQVFNGYGGKGGVAPLAKSRRILEGTPVDEGPLNAYSQMEFLDRGFWRRHGVGSYTAFKAEFGIWKEIEAPNGRKVDICVGYKNLDKLHNILKPYYSRVLKDTALDLPPKLYQHLRFDMSPEQWKIYNQLEEELHVFVQQEGKDYESLITAELPIQLVLRQYQITCGYLPFEEDVNGEPISGVIEFKENPRLEEGVKQLKKNTGKQVVWCRFTRDIELLQDQLGQCAVRYDGKIDDDLRAYNKREFLKGDKQYLICQIQAAARGHNFNICENVLYYSNDSRLRLRRQSEDRTHRGVMDFSVLYTDMLATDTVDEKRVKSLQKKLKTSNTILGDPQ
jgi:SNF2 family DNA or RNA helicase